MEEQARALLDGGASRVLAWERRKTPPPTSPSPSTSSSEESAAVLFSSFSPAPTDTELSALERLFDDREAAIRSGMVLEGKRFEVHRHHPPLVYGREMGTEPAHAEGAAVCRFEGGDEGEGGTAAAAAEKEDQRRGGRGGAAAKRSFAAISYRLPHVSARMVPLLQGFCGEVFGAAAGGGGAGEEEKAAVAGGGAA